MSKYLIWDWNGTLLDDTTAALNALNVQLVKRALKPITMEYYRDHFAFPARNFYAECGIKLELEDWDRLAAEYHEAYAREPKALNGEAIAVLERAKALGWRQCVLSALRQDLLEKALEEYGIRHYFDYVYGVDNLDGSSKLERAKELMEVIAPQSDITMIGDAIHDAEVAAELGVRCILVATGGHSFSRLSAVAPTVKTLSAVLAGFN